MKKNLIVGDLEIFCRDLPDREFLSGKALCSALRGGDWRIPTLKELGYLYELHKLGILGFNPTGLYWSDRSTQDGYNAVINFSTGSYSSKNTRSNKLGIRPVRNI